jgi:hypothetical protein
MNCLDDNDEDGDDDNDNDDDDNDNDGDDNDNDGDDGDDDNDGEAFNIRSDHAYLVCASSSCCRCRREIEVAAVYCQHGIASREPLEQFTVFGISAMEPALARQLERWPSFRFDPQQGCFANHCPHCGAPQDEATLHDEPEQPFFAIDLADTRSLRLTPLLGTVQLSGDYSVEA